MGTAEMRDTMALANTFQWMEIDSSRWESLSLRDYGLLVTRLCIVEEELFRALGALSENWEDGEERSVVWCSRASRIHGEALRSLRGAFPSPWPDLLAPVLLDSCFSHASGLGRLLGVVADLGTHQPSRRREIVLQEIYPILSEVFLVLGAESAALCGDNLRRICRGISLEAF